jgi:hypothetical protein
MHLTRDEACRLAGEMEQGLPEFEAGTIDRLNAITSLDNIRRVMVCTIDHQPRKAKAAPSFKDAAIRLQLGK